MGSPNNGDEGKIHDAEVVDEKPAKPSRNKRSATTAIAKREQDVAIAPPAPRVTVEEMIMKALEMDKPELIDKFVEIYEKQEAERRKAAYTAAMSRAQALIRPVAANAMNTHTGSPYAKRDAICRAIAPIYGAEGLSLSFRPGDAKRPGEERLYAVVMHKDGHIDDSSYYIDLPRDTAGSQGNRNKTELQGIGSTREYGRRYLTCDVFNVAVGDDDDDGNGGRKAQGGKDHRYQQPREKKTAQKDTVPPEQRPQIEPVSDSGEGIDKATAKGFSNAIASAFKGYGEDAFKIGWQEFQKRFPNITAMSQIPNTPEAKKIVLNWIADPQRN